MPNDDKSQDVNLDNVFNTGENTNRTPTSNEGNDNLTPEQIQAKADADKANADKAALEAGKTGDADDSNKGDLTPEEIAAAELENSNSLKTLLSSDTDESTLDAESKAIRSELLEKYKGTKFDVEGNILDVTDKIVATFKDVLKYSTEEETLTLDDKGNQVDTEGKIVKTVLDLAIENTVVNKIHSESDYEFQNDDGTTKIYSDDEDGIKELTNDMSAQRLEEWKSEFFNQTPELAEVTKHLLSGHTMNTYNSTVDYSKIDTTTLTKDDKLRYIRRSYEVSGVNEERVNSLMQLFQDSNTVDTEVDKALTALQTHEDAVTLKRDKDYQDAIDERNRENDKYWGEVEKVVNKGTLNDISIPKTEKAAFFEYLSTSIDDKGNSKEMLDTKKETLEQQLQVKYLRFKGYDLSKLVDSKVRTTKVISLRDRIRRSAKLKSTPINDAKESKTSGETNITIDTLLS